MWLGVGVGVVGYEGYVGCRSVCELLVVDHCCDWVGDDVVVGWWVCCWCCVLVCGYSGRFGCVMIVFCLVVVRLVDFFASSG